MKKLFLTAAIGLFGLASAQLQQGNWMVGSDLMNMRFTNGLDIQLNPKAAYFIQNRWAVGAGVSLDIQKVNGSSTTQTNWAITPFTRYYFSDNQVDNLLNNGAFFGEGSLGFGGNNSGGGSTTNGVKYGIGAGYAYFITNNVSVEGLLKFDGITGGGNNSSDGDLSLGVGFNIYLSGKKAERVLKDQQ